MTGHVFYPTADATQDRIWSDTVEKWGEKQAIAYIQGLHNHLQRLSETPHLWRRLPSSLVVPIGMRAQAYFSRYESHYLFFRQLPSGKIGVIMHWRMDLPAHLLEDLSKLSDKDI